MAQKASIRMFTTTKPQQGGTPRWATTKSRYHPWKPLKIKLFRACLHCNNTHCQNTFKLRPTKVKTKKRWAISTCGIQTNPTWRRKCLITGKVTSTSMMCWRIALGLKSTLMASSSLDSQPSTTGRKTLNNSLNCLKFRSLLGLRSRKSREELAEVQQIRRKETT